MPLDGGVQNQRFHCTIKRTLVVAVALPKVLKINLSSVKWWRHGLVVRTPDLESGGPGFKSRSDHLDLFHDSPVFKSKATLCVMFSLYIYFTDFIVSPISATVLNTSALK